MVKLVQGRHVPRGGLGVVAKMEDKAQKLGFVGLPCHEVECHNVWDRRDTGSRHSTGKKSKDAVTYKGQVIGYIYYVRTGFLEGHYETKGKNFIDWGGSDGAFGYCAAVGIVELLEVK